MVKEKSSKLKKVAIAVVVVGFLVAAASIIYANLFKDNFFADKKFEELARNYYENELYENFIVEHEGEDLGVAFSKYTKGFTVKLRQLLNNEFLKNNQNYRSYFENSNYSCDTNSSFARFIPKEPYGKTDYDIELNLNCNKK